MFLRTRISVSRHISCWWRYGSVGKGAPARASKAGYEHLKQLTAQYFNLVGDFTCLFRIEKRLL